MAREMTAMRRLSRYLKEKHPEIESCQDISRAIVEDYLNLPEYRESADEGISLRIKQTA